MNNARRLVLIALLGWMVHQSFAATNTWVGGSGDWGVPANWSAGTLPGPADDVVIDQPGDITVTHSSGNHDVKSLLVRNTMVLSGGSLSASNVAQLDANLVMAGGTLARTTLVPGTNGQPLLRATTSGGTLDATVLNVPVLVKDQSRLSIINGLTLNSVITIGGTNYGADFGRVGAMGDQVISGSGEIFFNQDYNTGVYVGDSWVHGSGVGMTLTIGPAITVRGRGGDLDPNGGVIINQGNIVSGISNGLVYISYHSGAFTNYGSIVASNNARLTVQNASFCNFGTISVNDATFDLNLSLDAPWVNNGLISGSNAVINLGGTFRTSAIGTLERPNSTVRLIGVLDNTGSSLTFNELTGFWILAGGTIRGGIINSTNVHALIANEAGTQSTLDEVTLNAPLFIPNQAEVRVLNGLTMNNRVTLGSTNYQQDFGRLTFVGSQTFAGSGSVNFDLQGTFGASGNRIAPSDFSTLTIGPGLTVFGRSGAIGRDSGTGVVINQGRIISGISNGLIVISGYFTNAGTILITNSAEVSFHYATWGNTGTIIANSGTLETGYLDARSWMNSGTISVTNSALNLGGTFTSSALGDVRRSLSSVSLIGTLENTGQTFTLNDDTGIWYLNGGTIHGGVINSTNSLALVALGAQSTLDGVRLNAPLLIRGQSEVKVVNGLNLGSTVTIGSTNYPLDTGRLNFYGNQTLRGDGTIELDLGTPFYGEGNGVAVRVGSSLNISRDVKIHGRAGIVGGGWFGGSGGITDEGSVFSQIPAGAITLAGQPFLQRGDLVVAAGSVVTGRGSFAVDGDAAFETQQGSDLTITGDLLGNTQSPVLFSPLGRITFAGSGTVFTPQFVEAMSRDLGAIPPAFLNNFAYGKLAVSNSTYVRLVDQSDNAPGGDPEALYVNSLIVSAGATLDLNGRRLYARVAQIAGTLTGGTITQLPDSGPLAFSAQTDGSLAIAGELDEWTFFGRAGQSITAFVDTGSGNVLSPQLSFAEVRLLDPFANTIRRDSNTVARQTVALTDVLLPSDGIYRLQVRAPANQAGSSGNYQVTVWNVTADVAPLVLNQTVNGRIETPYSVDRWTFSAVAGQQVRLRLLNASAPGIAFDLRGPTGWIGFSNITDDSGLVTLPQSGAYDVTAHGLNGQFGIDYAFQLLETIQIDLALGTNYIGQFIGDGQAQLFRVSVPGNQPIRVTLQNTGTSNRTELYSGFGLPPTRGAFGQAAIDGTGANREILVDAPYAGTWYVLVYGDRIQTPGPFSLTVEAAPFFLSSLTPDRSGKGNNTVVEIQGAGFDAGVQVSFEGNGISRPASVVTRVGSTRMVAQFDLFAVPTNTYSLVVRQSGVSNSLPFEVLPGAGAHFDAQIIVPTGVGLDTVNTFFVEYSNTGDAPIVAPLLAVKGAGRVIPYLSIDPSAVSRDFWSGSRPSEASQTVTFFASGRIPGVLLPGESGRVPVYFLGAIDPPRGYVSYQGSIPPGARIIGWRVIPVRPSVESESHLSFDFVLQQFIPPSIIPGLDGQRGRDQAVSWQTLRTNVPLNILPEAWEAIWRNYTNAAGNTLYGFFGMLQQNIDYLYRLGILEASINRVDDLVAFELAQADGLHMLRTLSSATDGYAPTPGVRLSFERTFPNSISGRYRVGALGRGWSHNWEYRLVQTNFGDVTVVGPAGSSRTFKPDVRGGYLTPIGDYAQLVSLPGGAFSLREKGGLVRAFDAAGNLDYVEDPNGNRVTCGYTGGLLTSLAHSAGQRLTFGYNGFGRIEMVADLVGRVTRFMYDGAGEHLTNVAYFDGRALNYQYFSGQGLQREHALKQIEYPDQTHQYFTYNTQGRLETTSRDGGAEAVTYSYDNAGTVYATDGFTNTTKFFFDGRGLLVRTENPKGEAVQFQRDQQFNLTGVIDPAGRAFHYNYDRHGNMKEIVNPLGDRTQFAYDAPLQRLSDLVDANGNPTHYSYDDRGNLRGITYANGKSETWGVDAFGNPNTWTNRRNHNIEYQFNPTNGLLMAKLYPDGSRADYGYDDRGNLRTASNYTGRITLDYYPTNDRLQRITYPGGQWLEYTYDSAGRRKTMMDQLGYQLLYDYDGAGRLRSLTNSQNVRLVHYHYDDAGRLKRKTLGNGVYTTYVYDSAGRLEKLTNALANDSVLSFFNYAYDERGRRTNVTTQYGFWAYRFDALGQITNALLTSIAVAITNRGFAYEFDSLGNRKRSVENGVVTDYQLNDVNQVTLASGALSRYDDDGNLIEDDWNGVPRKLRFSEENLLLSVEAQGSTISFNYNALGQRMATEIDGERTFYVWDPFGLGTVVSEFTSSSTLLRRDDYGLGLIGETSGGGVRYMMFDGQGNLSHVVTSTGILESSIVFAPFGSTISEMVSNVPPFLFAGEFGARTERFGLVQMRARFFDSTRGSFLSEDPVRSVSSDDSPYLFAYNNPISYVDPSGLIPVRGESATKQDYINYFLQNNGRGPGDTRGAWETAKKTRDERNGDLENLELRDAEHYLWTLSEVQNAKNKHLKAAQMLIATIGYTYVKEHADVAGLIESDIWHTSEPTASELEAGLQGIIDGLDWDNRESKTLVPIYAYDPNQKLVQTGIGDVGYVDSRALLPYRVDFENGTNATAPAQQVIVSDRLASTLDWSTFELTEIAFGDERIALPPQIQHFETNLPITFSGFNFVVQIHAGIRLDSGEVSVLFRSIDLNTDLPPPATIGFLPPEDGTGRGQGHVSFVVRPKANLSSGTEIRNVAVIQFDNGEIISTDQVAPHDPYQGVDTNKQARVTIDAGAPTSSVAALPVESGHAFWVRWSGQDEPGGSGVATYDVYSSTNGSSFGLWIAGTNGTSAPFIGELGHTYAFFSIARDLVGHSETLLMTADTQTTVITNAPLLKMITNQVVSVGEGLTISNMVQGMAADAFIWSLGARAPAGVSINPSNGVFRWTPSCSQGRTTNTITVWATERTRTNVSDAMTFSVAVKDCVSPQLGRLVVRAGGTGRLPIDLVTSVPLTNLTTLFRAPSERLLPIGIEAVAPEICTNSISFVSNSLYAITLTTCSNDFLVGTQQVAWLLITAATNQQSAFVPIEIGPSVGTQPDGTLVTNYVTQNGVVVVVGEEPLLEALRSTNGLTQFMLYSIPGTTNALETTTNLPPLGTWSLWQNVSPTNLLHSLTPLQPTNRTLFLRAVRQQ